MYETINEPIDMIAIFGKGYQDIKPYKFRWGAKEFVVTKIGYMHKVKDGKKVIHIFSATDGTNFFELRFDAEDVSWLLGRTWDGNAT